MSYLALWLFAPDTEVCEEIFEQIRARRVHGVGVHDPRDAELGVKVLPGLTIDTYPSHSPRKRSIGTQSGPARDAMTGETANTMHSQQSVTKRPNSGPLVLDLAADGGPVAVTCRVLGFCTQAFCKWKKHPITQRD